MTIEVYPEVQHNMSDRMTRLVVILDKENKESREMEAELQETMGGSPVDSLPHSARSQHSPWHPGYPGGRGFILGV